MARLKILALASVFALIVTGDAMALCRSGDKVTVLWKDNKWYDAKVLKAKNKGKRCFIKYVGYDKSYNEWVGGRRYLLNSQRVSALWKDGKWYNARVLDRRQNAYLVSYEGYDRSFDEWVNNDRISTGRK